ncbi:glycine zipper family protein [Woodsholea maritima]|uniref:glycine zipper family protein n=1 Tax=Woodsholea maritima TaxID=240237 RepID=UPI0003610046|nr:glycine zipper family protein [Woodsholea maritima]
MKLVSVITLGVIALSTAACANSGASYRPIVDGPQSATYESDLAACQGVAQQRSYLNGDVRNDALIGAAVGGAIGLVTGDSEDAWDGALGGGLMGGGAAMHETRGERRDIVIECMKGRGHNVVG